MDSIKAIVDLMKATEKITDDVVYKEVSKAIINYIQAVNDSREEYRKFIEENYELKISK